MLVSISLTGLASVRVCLESANGFLDAWSLRALQSSGMRYPEMAWPKRAHQRCYWEICHLVKFDPWAFSEVNYAGDNILGI